MFTTKWRNVSDITEIFLTSRNPAELKFIWLQWRNVTGAAFKQNYTDFISLMQTVAQMNSKEIAKFGSLVQETNFSPLTCNHL